jgi:hypothetical protein
LAIAKQTSGNPAIAFLRRPMAQSVGSRHLGSPEDTL